VGFVDEIEHECSTFGDFLNILSIRNNNVVRDEEVGE